MGFWEFDFDYYFRTAIVDECGEIVYWADKLTDNEIKKILEDHREWRVTVIR